MRILVVEDDRDAAAVLNLFLTRLGHEVRVVYDGWSGIVEASAFRPDVVLSDIVMPRLNGYDLARTLRSQEAFQDTLLIAVTARGEPADVATAFAMGFDHHLKKPYNLDEIMRLLGSREAALVAV